nr:ferritin heavy chain-like [Desmodus rotundus]XP_053772938.1 ferritin heavy chain-like [Desmodus rotundus]
MATALVPWHVRQNYHAECEAAINNLVNLELDASYVYMSMACYFDREDVALKHFSLFFLQQSNTERKHAEKLLWLQSQRGGNPRLRNISRPEGGNWESSLRVLECALHLAQRVHQSLLNLQQLATEKKDGRVCNFLERHYLHEKVMFIQELEDHITNLRKLETPEDSLADSLFDKLTLGDSKN